MIDPPEADRYYVKTVARISGNLIVVMALNPLLILTAGLLVCVSAPTAAQTIGSSPPASDSARSGVLLDSLGKRLDRLRELDLRPLPVVSPGVSSSTPTAQASRMTALGFWMSFQTRTRYTHSPDGALGMGLGIGDVRKIRVQGGVAILDLGLRHGEVFGSRGSWNVRASRTLGHGYGVSVGVENALVWGGSDVPTSGFAVLGNDIRLKRNSASNFGSVAWSVGIGTGRYRTEHDIWAGRGSVNVFGSIATRAAKPASVFLEWSGQDANAGVSFTPLPHIPFAASWTLIDVLGTAGDGARLAVSAGYRFSL